MIALAFAIVAVGSIANVVCALVLLYKAFKTSILWGLGSIFVPFVHLFFIIKFWDETKVWFLRQLAAFGVMVVGFIIIMLTAEPVPESRAAFTPPPEVRAEAVSTPTPQPLPPGPAEAHEYSRPAEAPTWIPQAAIISTPSPTPAPRLENMRDRWVELTMNSGQEIDVKILAIGKERIRVELRVGGGSIQSYYSRADIASFRPLG